MENAPSKILSGEIPKYLGKTAYDCRHVTCYWDTAPEFEIIVVP